MTTDLDANMPKRYGHTVTRRLPDTYNIEVINSSVGRGSGVVNTEQFEFLKDVEELRPSGDPKISRRLHELKHMADAAHLMVGTNRGELRSERYRG